MLLWIFRAIFWLVVSALLYVNVGTIETSSGATSDFWVVIISGLGMAIFVFLLEVLTPKRKFAALAGVFFALLVGMLISIPRGGQWDGTKWPTTHLKVYGIQVILLTRPQMLLLCRYWRQ